MKKVCILLSTYNGERYLKEQLESLVRQENVDVSILVRDDGSHDATCVILDEWQDKGLLNWYTGGNKGFAMSFMDLVQNSGDFDYYAFCDQDDIWFSSKVYEAIQCMSTLHSSVQLYCSNTILYKNGEDIGFQTSVEPKSNIYTCLVRNIAPGCTMVFNKELRDLIISQTPDFLIAHDYWVYQVAMIFGEVYYDMNSYMYYRQHSNNQIGVKTSHFEIWKRRIDSFFGSKKEYGLSLQAKELLNCFSAKMSDTTRKIVSLVADYKDSIWKRVQFIFDCRYTMGRLLNNVLLRIKILFGRL